MTQHYSPPAPKTLTSMEASVPIAFFPVRLETRFVEEPDEAGVMKTTLKIRFYPDALHSRTVLKSLTAAEIELGNAYWASAAAVLSQNNAAGTNVGVTNEDALHSSHWDQLVRTYGAPRALWIVDQTSTFPTPAHSLGVPLLPTRWRVVGYSSATGEWHKPVLNVLSPNDVAIAASSLDERILGSITAADTAPTTSSKASNTQMKSASTTTPTRFDAAADASFVQMTSDSWLTDFDEAVKVGMAMTVTEADFEDGYESDNFSNPSNLWNLELLMAVGYRKGGSANFDDYNGVEDGTDPTEDSTGATSTAQQMATEISTQFQHLAFGHGVSFPSHGVSTNQLDDRQQRVSALNPSNVTSPDVDSAASRFTNALGISESVLGTAPSAILGSCPGADKTQANAVAMATVLWEPTIGYVFRQLRRAVQRGNGFRVVHGKSQPTLALPGLDMDQFIALRSRFIDLVRGGQGALPLIRVGDQPYGVLPVATTLNDRSKNPLLALVDEAREHWGKSVAPDSVEDIGEIHATHAWSEKFFSRTLATWDSFAPPGYAGPSAPINGNGTEPIEQLGLSLSEAGLVESVALDRTEIPWVDPSPTFFDDLLTALTQGVGGYAALCSMKESTASILEGTVLLSAQEHVLAAAWFELASTDPPTSFTPRWGHDVGGTTFWCETPWPNNNGHSFPLAWGGENGNIEQTTDAAGSLLVDLVCGLSDTNLQLRNTHAHTALIELRAALTVLSNVESTQLKDLFGQTMDVASHRLDAWITSLAAGQLNDARQDQASDELLPQGTFIGGYGWVENLSLQSDDADVSDGFIHTPSIGHANTAAVLRSGYRQASASGGANESLAFNLSAERVRVAQEVIAAVRRGQSLGAILGYRFERSIVEQFQHLAKLLFELRQLAPLEAATASEDVGVQQGLDGLTLIERFGSASKDLAPLKALAAGNELAELQERITWLETIFDAVLRLDEC